MTLISNEARIVVATNSGDTMIPTHFKVQREADLQVYRKPYGQDASLLVLGTHYSITGLGETSAIVTLVTPAITNDNYILQRVVDIVQDLNLRNQGGYLPETLEIAGLDRFVMMVQMLAIALNPSNPSLARALLLGVGDVVGSGAYDALSNRIKNLDDGVDPQDAATVAQLLAAIGGVTTGSGGFVNVTLTAAQVAAISLSDLSWKNKVVCVHDAGLPDVIKMFVLTSSGTTVELVTLAGATT